MGCGGGGGGGDDGGGVGGGECADDACAGAGAAAASSDLAPPAASALCFVSFFRLACAAFRFFSFCFLGFSVSFFVEVDTAANGVLGEGLGGSFGVDGALV